MYQPTNRAERRLILERTHGRCHLCNATLCISNYGKFGRRGCWEVDHSKAQAAGGTHHGNNLLAACITCNRSKQDGSSKAFRQEMGLSAKPMSTRQRERKRSSNAIGGAFWGGLLGLFLGPAGAVVGAIALGAICHSADPEA